MPPFSATRTLSLLSLLAMATAYLSRSAERAVLRALRAEVPSELPPALSRALSGIGSSRRGRPEVLLTSEPSPRAWVARSLGGAGKVILSQGLLTSLGEAELRAVLAVALGRAAERIAPLRTGCAALALGLDPLYTRTRWAPLVAVAGSIAYLFHRALAGRGRRLDLFSQPSGPVSQNYRESWEAASSRVNGLHRLHGRESLITPVSFL